MYNLFITAIEDTWDGSTYEIDRGRFLEYTTETIAKNFSSLDRNKIAYLKALPCLFAYEGNKSSYRLGKITSLKAEYNKIAIEFKIIESTNPISFEIIDTIKDELDIRNWEINRTHWAVKDVNLIEVLESHGIYEKSLKKETSKPKIAPKKSNNPTIKSVSDFIKQVLKDSSDKDFEYFYRGHSNKEKYKLEPSLFRKDKNGNYLHLNDEHIIYRELIIHNPTDFSSDAATFDKLVRMQHYSLPTRLLDITSNPLIVLYFSCKNNPDLEGEIITFGVNKEEIKYFDSDTASCISNLVNLPKNEKDTIIFDTDDIEKFNGQTPIKRLVHFVSQEKPFFEPRIIPEDLKRVICVKSKKSNSRISSQSGAFLLFGLDSTLNEDGTDFIQIKRYTITEKNDILSELDRLNINESTVFPYIENTAKYLTKKYEFKAKPASENI